MNKKKLLFYMVLILCPILIAFSIYENPIKIYNIYIEILVIFISVMASVLSYYFRKRTGGFWYKLLFFLNVLSAILFIIWTVLEKYNLLDVFTSISSFKAFILSTKEKGMLIYVAVQILQVMFVPIPSMIITLTGVAIYGPFLGALLCSLGVLLGSYLSFAVGKVFGFRVVSWMVGKDNANKYAQIINDRGKFFLIIAFLLPLFPDDILCLIAGLTTMKFKHFAIIAGITRPIGVICMSYFGGGYVIPFSGWGLYVWPIILIIAIAAVVITTKFQPQLEGWVLTKINVFKLGKKKKNKQ